VAVELSPYDLNRGRIVYRYKWWGSYGRLARQASAERGR